VVPEDFNGPRTIIRNILAAFTERDAEAWFMQLGVPLKTEGTGKLFPISNRAATVLDALVDRAAALGVELCSGQRVTALLPPEAPGAAFTVQAPGRTWRARRVILAAGGRSLPGTGSDGSGYTLAASLGHSVSPTFPALVPLCLANGFFHAQLAGVAQPVELTIRIAGRAVDRRTGSLLWTHFGVSGPVVLDASRHWLAARAAAGNVELLCNVLPGTAAADADALLVSEAQAAPRLLLGKWLAERMPARVGDTLCRHVGADPASRMIDLPREARRQLAGALTALPLPVTQDRGWNYAEVTAGGVPLAEIDFRTMASRRCPGLSLAGELLDCDGRIGGFNFQWAWATGYLAGTHAARACLAEAVPV
jgi:hypothetical protein